MYSDLKWESVSWNDNITSVVFEHPLKLNGLDTTFLNRWYWWAEMIRFVKVEGRSGP